MLCVLALPAYSPLGEFEWEYCVAVALNFVYQTELDVS